MGGFQTCGTKRYPFFEATLERSVLVPTASQVKGQGWELGGLCFPPGSSRELAGLQVVRFATLGRFALALLLYLLLSPSRSFFTLLQERALSSFIHSFILAMPGLPCCAGCPSLWQAGADL